MKAQIAVVLTNLGSTFNVWCLYFDYKLSENFACDVDDECFNFVPDVTIQGLSLHKLRRYKQTACGQCHHMSAPHIACTSTGWYVIPGPGKHGEHCLRQ
jgi:hypothetical protein